MLPPGWEGASDHPEMAPRPMESLPMVPGLDKAVGEGFYCGSDELLVRRRSKNSACVRCVVVLAAQQAVRTPCTLQ